MNLKRTPLGRFTDAIGNRIERSSETFFAYLVLSPVIVFLFVFAIWPVVRTIEISLHGSSFAGASPIGEFIGLNNYIGLFQGEFQFILPWPFFELSKPFQSALIVTLIITFFSVIFSTLLGLGLALVLNHDFRGRGFVRSIVILPWAVPKVIQGMMFYLLFIPSIGFIVEPLSALGLMSNNPLINSQDSLIIVTLIDIWRAIPFAALIILAGLQSIDQTVYDVADVAGASRWQRFRTVTLPLVMPSLLIAMMFRTIATMKVYGVVETAPGCNVVPTLTCLVVSLFRSQRWGLATAISTITAGIIGLLVIGYVVKFSEEVNI
jgi:multiple sugar transport system permease protein